ncbi:hypothetical protein [Synechococcus sp. CS-1332]|uniref:hypothetical protein n=1 Tax=Synechococcus sp. CS-1332 TaxID=2847972 RepID=UPI00223BD156|nr:hypothetical protein [Synechococcus sp. CS-1332]MCT0206783.1 hypothetical protein [Synechococcus sp. CS-1332]
MAATSADAERLSGSRWQVFGDEATDKEGPLPLSTLAWSCWYYWRPSWNAGGKMADLIGSVN